MKFQDGAVELDVARAKLERAQIILERSYERPDPKLVDLHRELARLQKLEAESAP